MTGLPHYRRAGFWRTLWAILRYRVQLWAEDFARWLHR
jgi:hypothetical protein